MPLQCEIKVPSRKAGTVRFYYFQRQPMIFSFKQGPESSTTGPYVSYCSSQTPGWQFSLGLYSICRYSRGDTFNLRLSKKANVNILFFLGWSAKTLGCMLVQCFSKLFTIVCPQCYDSKWAQGPTFLYTGDNVHTEQLLMRKENSKVQVAIPAQSYPGSLH